MKKTFIKKISFILVLLIIISSNSAFAKELTADGINKNNSEDIVLSETQIGNTTTSKILVQSGDKNIDGIYKISKTETEDISEIKVEYDNEVAVLVENLKTNQFFLNGKKIAINTEEIDSITENTDREITMYNNWNTKYVKRMKTDIVAYTATAVLVILVRWCPGVGTAILAGWANNYAGRYIGMSVEVYQQTCTNYNGTWKVGMRKFYQLYKDSNWKNFDRRAYTAVTTR